MLPMSAQLLAGLLTFWAAMTTVSGLTCYQCANVEVKSSGFLEPLKGKSDPTCGAWPTESNSVECGSGEVCGAVNGVITAMSMFKADVQIRGCVPQSALSSSEAWGGCTKTDSLSNVAIGRMLNMLTKISDMQFSGSVCTCNFDFCSLCDGGFNIGGYCMKYWMLGLIAGGVLLILIALISCCCCCCGCCCCRKKGSPGLVHSAPYHTLTVIQTPNVHGPAPNQLSVQSGDIFHQPANQHAAVGGATVGLMQDKEHAGYNQKGDQFGPALA